MKLSIFNIQLSTLLACLLLGLQAFGQERPGATFATQAEVTAGTVANKYVSPKTLAAAGMVTNGAVNIKLAGVQSGIQLAQMFEKLVVIADSKAARLGNPSQTGANKALGWSVFGGYTNSSIATAATNQLDGTIWYGTGAYATNNYSLFEIWTNQIYQQTGYAVQLDTAAAVPGQSAGNAGTGYPSWMVTGDKGGQTPANGTTYSADGTNSFYIWGWGGKAGTAWTWFPQSTNDLYFKCDNTYYTNYGTNVTFMPTNSGQYRVWMFGTPNSNCATARFFAPTFAGQQNNYAPPYRAGTGSMVNELTNISTSVWIASNNPSITGKRTALVVGPLGGNDFLNGNNSPVNPSYTPWDNSVGWTNRMDLVYTNLLYCCRVGRTNGLFPIFITQYPWAYNVIGSSGALATNLMTYLNQRIAATSKADADIWVGFNSICNPTTGASSSTNFIDATHFTSAFATNMATFTGTNTAISSVIPKAGWVPIWSVPASSYQGLWNSNNTGGIFYVQPNVSTNHVTGP